MTTKENIFKEFEGGYSSGYLQRVKAVFDKLGEPKKVISDSRGHVLVWEWFGRELTISCWYSGQAFCTPEGEFLWEFRHPHCPDEYREGETPEISDAIIEQLMFFPFKKFEDIKHGQFFSSDGCQVYVKHAAENEALKISDGTSWCFGDEDPVQFLHVEDLVHFKFVLEGAQS